MNRDIILTVDKCNKLNFNKYLSNRYEIKSKSTIYKIKNNLIYVKLINSTTEI